MEEWVRAGRFLAATARFGSRAGMFAREREMFVLKDRLCNSARRRCRC